MKLGNESVACYRDEGRLTQVSAVCTHMGCTSSIGTGQSHRTAPATAPASRPPAKSWPAPRKPLEPVSAIKSDEKPTQRKTLSRK
ncbi:MAG: hypothetical protein U0903_01310 [Planctomycetales bacterium]